MYAAVQENKMCSGENYFLVQRSSPVFPPLLGGLALRPLPLSRFEGSQPPPPPSLFVGWSLRSNLWPARRDETKSFEASRRCIKLQNPPRLHSPFSFWRQQASRKSVTGESSAYKGLPKVNALVWDSVKPLSNIPAYQRSLQLSTAAWASVSHSYRA